MMWWWWWWSGVEECNYSDRDAAAADWNDWGGWIDRDDVLGLARNQAGEVPSHQSSRGCRTGGFNTSQVTTRRR